MLKDINHWLFKNSLYLAWSVALVSLVGSFYFGEIVGLEPCVLCWYQRIAMYPLVAIIWAGIIRRDKAVSSYTLPLSIIGGSIALYHNLLIWRIIPESLEPCAIGTVPCITQSFAALGFITFPLLSLVSFILITGLMFAHRSAHSHD